MDNNSQSPVQESALKGQRNMMVPLVIIGLIVIAAVGIFAFQGQEKQSNSSAVEESVQSPTPVATDSEESSQSGAYKDGIYTVAGNYTSPGGVEQLGVTVTLKDDVIVDSEVSTENAQRPNTIKFQGIFKDNYKSFVTGKNIDDVKLDKVSASSLAPKGFNDALEKIKAEARA